MKLGELYAKCRYTVRRRGGIAAAGVVCTVVWLFAMGGAQAQAGVPAPAWQIASLSVPTEFSAADSTVVENQSSDKCELGEDLSFTCDQFDVRVVNVGGAVSAGSPVTVVDTLPTGLTTKATPHSISALPGFQTMEEGWSCTPSGSGRQTVKCTYELPVPALGQLPPIDIPVQVGAVPPNALLTNLVEVSGGGAASVVKASSGVLVEPSAQPLFGVEQFSNYLADPAGMPAVQAGAHPGALYTNFELNTIRYGAGPGAGPSEPAQEAKNLVIDLPVGFVGDPRALPRCPLSLLPPQTLGDVAKTPEESGCPADTRIGTISFSIFNDVYRESFPLYNLVPDRGYAAELGLTFEDERIVMLASIAHTPTGYVVRVSVPGVAPLAKLQGAEVTVFGNPAREDKVAGPGMAFFRSPSDCSGAPQLTSLHADSWENPAPVGLNSDGSPDLNAANFSEPEWQSAVSESPPVDGCEELSFEPSFRFRSENTEAGAAAGYTAELRVPQEHITEPEVPATPDLKKAVVTLPEGLVADPSLANGLQACSEAQIGLDTTAPPSCPEASKIGTVEVLTPLLPAYESDPEGVQTPLPGDHPLPGAVYLAAQDANPFHSLLALYVVVDDPETGIVVKLAGEVKPDPSTGRLTATFDDNPQFPFEEIKLAFKHGPRAPLTNPATCGAKTTRAQLTPWSAPQSGPPWVSDDTFQIASGAHGAPCVANETEEPNRPGFSAGMVSANAGAFSPFVLTLTRGNGSQAFKDLEVTLPPGLTGKLAGIAQCPQADVEAAERASGGGETVSPSCPAASEVGVVNVGAGSGTLFNVQGHAYLAGPYNGAPFSLAIVTPAVAGPFDLGTVVVRSALYVNPETAQVTVRSDPIPTILDGIPLDIKSIVVDMDRPGFTLNPTNCAPMAITGTLTASFSTAALSTPFQAGGCANLPFAPSFTASTQAKTSKADGASLTVKVSQKPGEANIHKVELQLPKVLPARLTTLQKACTEAQFNTNPAGCPEASDIGTATAITPLLDSPLSGPAYLVSHGGAAFPDVVFLLQGEGVQIDLDGKTDIKKGITYSKFETVPDDPISSFVTVLPEGPHSALAANENLCNHSLTTPTTIVAQNGKAIAQSTKIAVTGCPRVKRPALSRAQQLARALKACRKDKKSMRTKCEKRAREQYGVKSKIKTKR